MLRLRDRNGEVYVTFNGLKIASVVGAGLLLAAAAPDQAMNVQITDLGPLGRSEPVVQPRPAKVITFQNTMYQAAPMPDEDRGPPSEAVRTEAEVAPKVLSPHTLFQGDGYAQGSSSEGSIANRKAGAAGLGLSVPVN